VDDKAKVKNQGKKNPIHHQAFPIQLKEVVLLTQEVLDLGECPRIRASFQMLGKVWMLAILGRKSKCGGQLVPKEVMGSATRGSADKMKSD